MKKSDIQKQIIDALKQNEKPSIVSFTAFGKCEIQKLKDGRNKSS